METSNTKFLSSPLIHENKISYITTKDHTHHYHPESQGTYFPIILCLGDHFNYNEPYMKAFAIVLGILLLVSCSVS